MKPPSLVDTHVHLDSTEYEGDLPPVLERARAAGVEKFLTVGAGSGIASAHAAVALANTYEDVWASVGVHPHDASAGCSIADIERLVREPRVVAIGETGLDFHYDFATREDQERMFLEQISLAKRAQKPLIIHCREAAHEIGEILKRESSPELRGVFHCFSENALFAEEMWELGFYVSVGGMLTFKKADAIRGAFAAIPLERILLETDGPFLAPVPHRGKRCESAFLPLTARCLAETKGISIVEVAEVTSANAETLFSCECRVSTADRVVRNQGEIHEARD